MKSQAQPKVEPLVQYQCQNPIFVEFYPHTKSECYKIRIPWTKYRSHTLVLCEVKEGIEEAKRLAKLELQRALVQALQQPVSAPPVEP